MSDDVAAANTPMLRRKKFAAASETAANPSAYGWSRWLQGYLGFCGMLSILLGLLAFLMAALALGESIPGAFALAAVGLGTIIAGFMQFALAELLGGLVKLLVKNDCYP